MLSYNQKVKEHALEIDGRIRLGEEDLLLAEHPWLKDRPFVADQGGYEWLMKHFVELDTTRIRDQGMPLNLSLWDIRRYADEILGLTGEELESFVSLIRGLDNWLVSRAHDEFGKKQESARMNQQQSQKVNKRDVL